MQITSFDASLFTTEELLTIARTGKLNPASTDYFSMDVQNTCKREATRRLFADEIPAN